ncbi:protein SMG9 [Crotalus adamanteus]|uniref:Protein SMG9 n=1 Tax=Crotalus adamanteus TaxID=8729 RepID=A0AAW1AXM5_CROAD
MEADTAVCAAVAEQQQKEEMAKAQAEATLRVAEAERCVAEAQQQKRKEMVKAQATFELLQHKQKAAEAAAKAPALQKKLEGATFMPKFESPEANTNKQEGTQGAVIPKLNAKSKEFRPDLQDPSSAPLEVTLNKKYSEENCQPSLVHSPALGSNAYESQREATDHAPDDLNTVPTQPDGNSCTAPMGPPTSWRRWFLQTAEMVKPSTPSPRHESSSSSGSDEGTEYYPHIVFLQNKAKRENFCPRNLKQMHLVIDKIMMHSHLKYKGTLSMLECNIFPGLPQSYLDTEVNLFLLPFMDSETDDVLPRATPGSGPPFSLLPGYKGHPSFKSLIAKLRSQMMSMSRPQLSHTILTEKNWFHYAARIWDGVKKSSALSEYSRLLT